MRIKRIVGIFPILLMLLNCPWAGETQKKLSPQARALQDGKRMYLIRGCVQCHGPKGDGRGSRMARLNPPPRDFKELSAYKQGHAIKEIAYTLKVGITNKKSAMPAYPFLSDTERENLAKYVIYLREQKTQ